MFKIRNVSKTKLWVKITVFVAPLALMVFLAWIFVVPLLTSCGPEVERVDGQCIGVTDGQAELSLALADVLDEIRQENERVESADDLAEGESERIGRAYTRAVSVAYLVPLPRPSADDDPTDVVRFRHELEGAHIAQLQANRTQTLGGEPLVRLLVANSGDQSIQWQRVVPALLAKVDGPDRLVAVVATGNTVSGTLESVNDLRSHGVPVVMSRLAGDGLSTLDPDSLANVPGGLARLAPSGSDQGAAAAAYLRPTASRALIVRDTNPTDPYLRALDETFRGAFPDGTHTVLEPPETYDSRLGGVANAMEGILQNICLQEPEAVFFAGRSAALGDFVQALPRRPCPELPINVISGGSTVGLAIEVALGGPELRNGLNANASVRYTAQAHPEAWAASPESFSAASTSVFSSTCDYCFNTLFPGETLDDAGAIIGYDAIVTAVAAIRPGNDEPDLVSQEFNRLHGIAAVPGATGWISLDQFGNPVNKAVVILQVIPDGTLEFVQLSSALGSPCVPGTPPC